jgi:hypothetical protein
LPIVIGLLFTILVINLHYSSYAILSRKKEIDSRVQIAHFLKDYLDHRNHEENINLFFPANQPYDIMEFVSFLNYKNFPILIKDDEQKNNINKQNSRYLIMKGVDDFPGNLCVPFRPFKCFQSNQPNQNDLIIFLLGSGMLFNADFSDYVPQNLIDKYAKSSDTLFHYKPEFKGVEKILYFFCKNRINEQWLNAYIFTNFQNDSE